MREFIGRIVNYGTTGLAEVDRRRVLTINVVALIAALLNATYIVVYLAADPSEFTVVVFANTFAVLVALSAIKINGSGRIDVAMWVLFLAGLFNITAASLSVGTGIGVPLFFAILPATAALIAPVGDIKTPAIMTAMSLAAWLFVIWVDTPESGAFVGTSTETLLLATSVIGIMFFLAIVAIRFRVLSDVAEAELQEANERNEALLLNILPSEIAERLKAGEEVIADRVEGVSVLFADLVDSTPMSEKLTPTEMVTLLNEIFTPFDDLADELGLEKIKTVGDAYMVVGGIPTERPDHVEAIADMALRMREELSGHSVAGFGTPAMRFGIDTGPVVAGVIGRRKFSYDLWGDTVNTAARMESHGVPGEIQVTEAVRDALAPEFEFEERGRLEVKGKGTMSTWFLEGRKT